MARSRSRKPVNKSKKYQDKPGMSKDQRRDVEIIDTAERAVKSRTNDPTWYNAFPQFTKDAGSVPFSMPLGNTINVEDVVSANVVGRRFTAPGVLAMRYYPTPGYSIDKSSPINRAASRIYTFMRGAQKAAATYDSQDVLMMFMALDSCYIFHAYLRRLYGILNLYTPVNKYYPRTLIEMNGCDFEDLKSNIAELRGYINNFAIALGSFCVPKDLDIVVRHEWMTTGLYMDADATKAQTYMFVPAGFWKYNNTVTTGSQLDWVPLPLTGNTLAGLRAIGTSLYSALQGDEDAARISGDFFNALGREGVKQLSETQEGYQILPSFDKMVLSQIENATVLGEWAASYTPVISQDPSVNNGALIFAPQVTLAYSSYDFTWLEKRIINWHGEQPSPEEVIEMTRLTIPINAADYDGSGKVLSPKAFGADMICGLYISSKPVENATSQSIPDIKIDGVLVMDETNPSTDPTYNMGRANAMVALSAFDWHPKIPVWYSVDGQNFRRLGALMDYENATVVEDNQLAMMHEAAMTSLFNLPQMGFTNR